MGVARPGGPHEFVVQSCRLQQTSHIQIPMIQLESKEPLNLNRDLLRRAMFVEETVIVQWTVRPNLVLTSARGDLNTVSKWVDSGGFFSVTS